PLFTSSRKREPRGLSRAFLAATMACQYLYPYAVIPSRHSTHHRVHRQVLYLRRWYCGNAMAAPSHAHHWQHFGLVLLFAHCNHDVPISHRRNRENTHLSTDATCRRFISCSAYSLAAVVGDSS